MVKRAWSRGEKAGRLARSRLAVTAAGAICLAGLSGCSADKVFDAMNPVNWYRDVTGESKPDNSPDAANQANLESGSAEPYPNLGSVPNEPTRGLTQAERDALAQGLVADRDHAHYTDEQIRNGNAGATMPAQSVVPEEHLPGPPPAPVPPPPEETASAAPPASRPPPPGPVGASPDADLATPAPRETPEPQTPNPPPPPPQLKPLPPPEPDKPLPGAPPPHPETPAGPAEIGGVPIPAAPPVRPLPTPPAPAVPAAPPVASASARGGIGRYANSMAAGSIAFAAGSAALPADAGAEIAPIPALHQRYGGIVRIVGYAAPTAAGGDVSAQQLAAYQAALIHANAVKQALIAAGVAEADIVTEASPVRGAGGSPDRADIYVQY